MTTYNVTLQGIRPLLMHSGRLADRMNEHAKELDRCIKIAKKDKTDEAIIEAQKAEFIGSLYFDADAGPLMPTDNLQAAILEGARVRKNGQLFASFVEVLPGEFGGDLFGHPLVYKGPRDVEGLWANPKFRLTKSARVGQNKVQRTRPMFSQWSVSFQVDILEGGPDQRTLEDAISDAGARKGICDWTPRYGRFVLGSIAQA